MKGGTRGVTFFRHDPAAEHVWRGTFLWCQAHPTARGRCPSAVQFWGSLLFRHTSFDAERPNLMWEDLFSRVNSIPVKAGPQRSPIFGGSLIIMYAYTLYRRTTKFDAVTHMEKACFQEVDHGPAPNGRSSSTPRFCGFSIYDCTLKRTTKLGVVTHGEGLVFRW